MSYEYGEYVIYTDTNELGRAVETVGDKTRVCFSTGCTSQLTDNRLLRKATQTEIDSCVHSGEIGYNRFNDDCPDIDADCCYLKCFERFGGNE